MIIASIMTGTSVDGVDISIFDTKEKKELEYYEMDFSKEEKKTIESFLYPNIKNTKELASFNFWFSDVVSKYFNGIKFKNEIDGVVFHGQTIYHDPNGEIDTFNSTMQLGNGSYLAQKIKHNVLWDLRSGDIANGGQAAPLVIFPDKELFYEGSPLAIINIGGISNISYMTKDVSIAFDLGPGNSLMDAYVKQEWNLRYDKGGEIASKGEVIEPLLSAMMKDSYIVKAFPKSTGKEYFNIDFINQYLGSKKYKNADVLKTLTKYTCDVIVKHIKELDSNAKVLIAGGGANNDILMDMLKKELPQTSKLSIRGVDHNSREASAFAMFYDYYINGKKIGIATGSTKGYIPGTLSKY